MSNTVPQSYLDFLTSSEVEGNRSTVYKDTEGHLTAGVGHKLTAEELKKYKEGDEVPDSVRTEWLEQDAKKSYGAAQKQAEELGVNDPLFLERLGSVNFQLGTNWNKEHTETWKKLKSGDYQGALKEVEDSEWATQTPKRITQFQQGISSLIQPASQPQQITQPQQMAQQQYQQPAQRPVNPVYALIKDTPRTTAAVVQGLSQPSAGVNRATSYGEQFGAAFRGGSFQLGSDIERFKAIGNLLTGKEEAAQVNLNWADISDQDSSTSLATLGSLEKFLDAPSMDSFFSSVVRATGQFTPLALSSIGTGFGGAAASVLGKAGVSMAGKAAFKQQFNRFAKKNFMHEHDKIQAINALSYGKYAMGADGKIVLNGSLELMKAFKRGGIAGAFSQEYLIGSAQALGEYQEAGYELTSEEAAVALGLGVPQALLGTLSEVSFLSAIGRTALRTAVAEGATAASRSASAQLVRDVVRVTAASAGIESLTEGAQEGLQAMQRLSIDPDFTEQEALMRVAEGAWAGFFAGGARGGVGGAASGVIGMARDMALKGAQYSADTLAGMQQKGLQFEDGPVPESQTRFNAQFEAMQNPDNGKKAVWVPESSRENFIEEETQKVDYKIVIPGQGVLYTNEGDIANLAQSISPDDQAGVENMLRQSLGYSRQQEASDGFVVQATNKDGVVIDEESTTLEGRDLAIRAMEEKYGKDNPNYKISFDTKEDAIYDRNLEIVRLKKGEKRTKKPIGKQRLTEQEKQDIRDQEFAEAEEAGNLRGLGGPDPEINNKGDEEIFGKPEEDPYEGGDTVQARQDFQIRGKPGLVLNDDGSPFEARPKGTFPDDAPKQEDLDEFNKIIEESEIDLDPEIRENLSQRFIRKFNRVSKENEGLQLSIREGTLGYVIRTQTVPGPQGKSAVLLTEEGVKEAESIARAQARKKVGTNSKNIQAELEKGWGLIDKETGEITYVSMVHLTNVGRTINQTKEDYKMEEELGDLRTARDGFTTIISELGANYDIQYGDNVGLPNIPRTAPVYSQAGEVKTIQDLLGVTGIDQNTGLPYETASVQEDVKVKRRSLKNPGPDGPLFIDEDGKPVFVEDPDAGRLKFTKEGKVQKRRVAPATDPGLLETSEMDSPQDAPEVLTPTPGRSALDALILKESKPTPEGEVTVTYEDGSTETYTTYDRPAPTIEKEATDTSKVLRRSKKDSKKPLRKKGFTPTKKGTEFADKQEENRQLQQAKELRKEHASKDERLNLRDPELRKDEDTERMNRAYDENVPIYEQKVKRDKYGEALKDKNGVPLFVKFTPKDRKSTLRTKQRKIATPANVFVSESLNQALPGIKDLFVKFSQRNFFGIHRDLYIFDQNAETLNAVLEKLPESTRIEVQEKVKEWRNNPKKKGRIISFGNTDFVFVKMPPKGKRNNATSFAGYLTLAHELGHVIFLNEKNRSLANPTLRKKLLEAYTKDRESGVYDAYNFEEGFDEWYADQVGTRLLADAASFVDKAHKTLLEDSARALVSGHFKQVFNKVKSLFNTLAPELRRRFKANPVFTEYVNDVTTAYKTATKDEFNSKYAPPTYIQEAYVADMTDATLKLAKEAGLSREIANKLRKVAKQVWGLTNKKGAEFITYAADNYLGTLGKGGRILRDMFYQQSQTISKAGRGYLNIRNPLVNQYVREIALAIGLTAEDKVVTDEARAILLEAEDNTIPDNKLSPKARAARQVLTNFKRNYLDRMVEETGRKDLSFKELFDQDAKGNRISYFTRQLNIQEIRDNPVAREALALAIAKYNNVSEKSAMNSVEALLSDGEDGSIEGISTEKDVVGNPYKLGMPSARQRTLRNIPTKVLRDEGILIPPEEAVRKYFDTAIKRTEFERRGGAKKVQEALNLIKDPVDRARAEETVQSLLGKSDRILHPTFRKAQSAVLTWNIITLLTFATLASLPDLAGPVLRSKDFGVLMPAVRTIANFVPGIGNKEKAAELKDLADEIGVVARQSMETMYINGAELEAMTPGAKKVAEGFFRYTGLEWYTKFTRVFATGMAEQFLMKHANSNTETSARYLAELNISKRDILNSIDPATGKFMFEGDRGQRVKMAMAQFVEESIVRPNAAERPTWVNDPRLQLVWQLKSFFYAYGKNVVGGAIREGQTRWNNGEGIGGPATLLALGGLTLLPLTMVGLELRELSKDLLAKALPFTAGGDRMYRTDNMEWSEYMLEIFDRSGVFGPFTLLMPMLEAEKYGDSFIVPPFGPTAEKIEDFLDEGIGGIADRSIPFYSSVGGVGAGFR